MQIPIYLMQSPCTENQNMNKDFLSVEYVNSAVKGGNIVEAQLELMILLILSL